MSDFELPGLAPHAAPEFIDAATAKTWLYGVPLVNVAAAQHQLRLQVGEFNRHATPAPQRLETLEVVREAVNFVQIEQAKRFIHRALPIAPAEAEVFDDTIDLWEQMRVGYLRCLAAAVKNEPGMRQRAGFICQRALAYSGLKMFHQHRAYRQVPTGEWRALHRTYATAEKLGVAEEPVKDYLNRDVQDASPRIAYMRALLMGLANPNELSQRQLTFVAYLLERWADKVEVSAQPVDEGDMPALVVDLAGDSRPDRAAAAAGTPRYLDTRRLAKSLRNRVGLLRKGESPAKLALGEDCVQPSCEQLLVFLYRQWCQPRVERALVRNAVSSVTDVCQDMAAIHFYLSGRVFHQPGGDKELTKKQRDEIATFGRVSTRDDDESETRGFLLEHWQLEDASAQGIRMMRRTGDAGTRYTHGQLIGVRAADASTFALGQVRWLLQAESGDLHAGIRFLPGLPAAVAVRPAGPDAHREKFVQALSLTAVAAIQSPPTLVLPSGWYRPKRVIEVFLTSAVRARLLEFLDRGSDFERLTYEIVQ